VLEVVIGQEPYPSLRRVPNDKCSTSGIQASDSAFLDSVFYNCYWAFFLIQRLFSIALLNLRTTTYLSTKLRSCLHILGGVRDESAILELMGTYSVQNTTFTYASIAPAVAPAKLQNNSLAFSVTICLGTYRECRGLSLFETDILKLVVG
jgi:hypothetical protein